MATLLQQNIHDERVPMGAHVGLISVFMGGLLSMLGTASKARRLPRRIGARDIALLGVATYKVSALIARDRVTEPIRAPFTEGHPEAPKPTGRGLQRAMGELLTCPHCVGPWTTLTLGAGLLWAPRATRFTCGLFGSMVVADVLHRVYSILENRQKLTRAEAEFTRESLEQIPTSPVIESTPSL